MTEVIKIALGAFWFDVYTDAGYVKAEGYSDKCFSDPFDAYSTRVLDLKYRGKARLGILGLSLQLRVYVSGLNFMSDCIVCLVWRCCPPRLWHIGINHCSAKNKKGHRANEDGFIA